MYEFKYTFNDIKNLTMDQYYFLLEGLKLRYKEERKAIAKGKSRARRRR